jgi:hypothetical protein
MGAGHFALKDDHVAWYLRKAIRIGPLLRLNLSKSGIGFSFGVKGARIGTGPRGSYLAAGRHGVYLRQSLSAHSEHAALPRAPLPISGYCTQCGSPLLTGNDFCNQCGCRVPTTASAVPASKVHEQHDHHVHWLVVGAAVAVLLTALFLAFR